MSAATDGVTVLVPVYRSDATLGPLVERVAAVFMAQHSPFEVVLVDDGSPSPTWDRCFDLSRKWPYVRSIRLTRNFGQHNALLAGLRVARYPVTVTLDDDLQHSPEEIPRLLAALDEGADVVYGTPADLPHGMWRNLASRAVKVAMSQSRDADIARSVSAFRAFRTELREAFAAFAGPHVSLDVLLSWAVPRFAAVIVPHQPRAQGRSGYTFGKLVRHTVNMLVGFSTWPLRLASIIGLGSTLLGLGMLAWVLTAYVIADRRVPGFAFLASTVIMFSGATLFALGIMGEYLARIYTAVLRWPTYTIRQDTGAYSDGSR